MVVLGSYIVVETTQIASIITNWLPGIELAFRITIISQFSKC